MKQTRPLNKDKEQQQQKLENEKFLQKKNYEESNEILDNILSSNIVKPTNIEAQRVLQILNQLSIDVEILEILDKEFLTKFLEGASVTASFSEAMKHLTPGCLKYLKRQAELEKKHSEVDEELINLKKQVQNTDDDRSETMKDDEEKLLQDEKERAQETIRMQKKKDTLENLIRENIKILVKSTKKNEENIIILKEMKNNNNSFMAEIFHSIKCIRTIMLKKLSTAAEEEENHSKLLLELQERITGLEKTKQQNESELEKLRKERQKHANEKKEEIDKLKKAIEDVRTKKRQKAERLKEKTTKNLDNLKNEFENQEKKLKEQIKTLQNELKNVIRKEHGEEEKKQLNIKKTTEDNLSEYIKQYDNQMEEWTVERSKMLEEYHAIKKELRDLEEHFKNVDAERKREEALEKEWELKNKNHDIEKRRRNEAGIHILNAYKLFKEKNKKGKGKGKGKKNTKKK